MRRLVCTVLLLAAFGWAAAEPYDSGSGGVSDTLLRAMSDELERTMEQLRLEDLEAPYFVAYGVLESRTLALHARLGALDRSQQSRTRRLQVELRVGAREFDDTHFVSGRGDYRSLTALLPVEDDYDALRAEIWALTDRAYKLTLERLARKRVYRDARNIQDALPDLSEDPVHSSRRTQESSPFDRARWEDRVRKVSAIFSDYPEIQTSGVNVAWRAQHLYLVDSEGRRLVKPVHGFEIGLRARAQAADGMVQSDYRRMFWQSLDQVPSVERIEQAATRLAEDLTALAGADELETYLGPVLLEGQAAGEFFNQLLASGVSNPRELWVELAWAEPFYKPGALGSRLGFRVISPNFDVVDDPAKSRFAGEPLLGHYAIDNQGIRARRVNLVKQGILVDLLMSRSPTDERVRSNGHGRGGFAAPATAGIGNLFVIPKKTIPLDEMKRKLRSEAKAFGLDHGILVRRISRENNQQNSELLSAPVLVYEVDVASGEERLVRDARFTSVTLRGLRDIIAASDTQHVYNLVKRGPFRSSSSFRASIVHPAILLSEMELGSTERKPSKLPHLAHPLFDATEAHAAQTLHDFSFTDPSASRR